ncbi:TIR domain-containing protein [Rhizobium phaseoli]|uniref:TIR domain-containing protein n=1 Tax=Rhizobium phaseoli TaxID=396 RepID=UPI0007EB3A9F|nr:TIR domain-containing protein [Rhizobium phaseoli]ANL74068.1 TIR domain-containing protein [Rhizobium phaseoli]
MTSHTDPSYVIFDGDEDKWAYAFMKGWNANERMDFSFDNAHDLDNMTSRAQGEDYVKRNLKARMMKSSSAIVLIGEKTKNLYKFVRWELELALGLGLPIIAANLNESRAQDERCPPIIRDKCVVHIPFKMRAIKHALDYWPDEFRGMSATERSKGWRQYSPEQYKGLGL